MFCLPKTAGLRLRETNVKEGEKTKSQHHRPVRREAGEGLRAEPANTNTDKSKSGHIETRKMVSYAREERSQAKV